MQSSCEPNAVATLREDSVSSGHPRGGSSRRPRESCFHCGSPCPPTAGEHSQDGKTFCCAGCLAVFDLLNGSGLDEFYQFGGAVGARPEGAPSRDRFRFLDEPGVRERIVDFSDERLTRVTFRLPAIHCVACVWLLENLFRLQPGIGPVTVNFPRKEVAIAFPTASLALSEVAALLASLGYEPELSFADLERPQKPRGERRLWLQLAVAGFAFGNTMLFSLASYLGLDRAGDLSFGRLFGYASLILSLPVLLYSASDYWRSAWVGLRHRLLTIEVPIAAGLAALFGQSCYEVISGRGEGYFDSMAGLLFFLLCGRLFQKKTFDRLSFDRDYRSFFPLSVARVEGAFEKRVPLSEVQPGDRLMIRHGDLLPADVRLAEGDALIDYSFVTGESDPVARRVGDLLYAGGRQVGGAIGVEAVKSVSQSYLTSLWNQDAFRKEKSGRLETMTNAYSRRFTWMILMIAVGAAIFWAFRDPGLAVKSFTSVLIVACPCALALAAPFTLGTAQRFLAGRRVFLKHPSLIETLARVDAVVFDKTGTLTSAGRSQVCFRGEPLSELEQSLVLALSSQSTHPHAERIRQATGEKRTGSLTGRVTEFEERPGRGMAAKIGGRRVMLGSAAWLREGGIDVMQPAARERGGASGCSGSTVHLGIDGIHRGCFEVGGVVREDLGELIQALRPGCEVALLSGDNDRERARFAALFGESGGLRFNQAPADKLEYVRQLQAGGRTVMMVGDGLNDAGALRQSDVGVAVVEQLSAFSPASDVILSAENVRHLHRIQRFARGAVGVVRLSFLISSLYNVVGLAIAASGGLAPVVCAILMPLSSVTVVAFACAATTWVGHRAGLGQPEPAAEGGV